MGEIIEQPPPSILIWAFGLSRNIFYQQHREAQQKAQGFTQGRHKQGEV